jgi:hypothetical protein
MFRKRHSLRREIIELLNDHPGKEALRQHNRALDSIPAPEWDSLVRDLMNDSPHSYGPSLKRLWAEAKRQGKSDEDAWHDIYRVCGVPARGEREFVDENRVPGIRGLVAEPIIWEKTPDTKYPWAATVGGVQWSVGVNDFPEEPLYSVSKDGEFQAFLHGWPQSWSRPDATPEVMANKAPSSHVIRAVTNIEVGRFHDRYCAGEHESVWNELTALGEHVRRKNILPHALRVARETMRRVRSNIETIVGRLDEIGYDFWPPERCDDHCNGRSYSHPDGSSAKVPSIFSRGSRNTGRS